MKGSAFASRFGSASQAERESRVFDLVDRGSFVRWPWKSVACATGSFRGEFYVASDYFAIGEEDDFLRLPISPILAQRIADRLGWTLPTARMVDEIWAAAEVRTAPSPWGPPYDATMTSVSRFVAHDARVTMQLDKFSPGWRGRLVAGHKKDVVLSNKLVRGRVAIYGWHALDGIPIQSLNVSSHADSYADYSHGARFVRGDMSVNGTSTRVSDVLSSSLLHALISDEGVMRVTRQPGTTREAEKAMMRGDSGSSVEDWQAFLNERMKVGLVLDGQFGAATEAATKAFQTSVGMDATGSVDSRTLAAAAAAATIKAASTPPAEAAIPFVQARNFTKAARTAVDLVVIHTMEAPDKPTTAESVARWFATGDAKASAHYCVDSDSIVQCVREEDAAWHAPGANRNGIGIEHAGYASRSAANWMDSSTTAMLFRSAKLVARICRQYGIPIVRLTADDLRAKRRGLCGHVDVTDAFNGGKGHTDPGPNFPWEMYLSMIRATS
jgi:N-acetyl-anhydromuramyl-L-alanine amidase AmpD